METKKKLYDAAREYRTSFAAEGSHMERCSDLSFHAGAKYLIDRAYDKERIQMLFDHIVDTTGGMLLENELFHIIYILTSDEV